VGEPYTINIVAYHEPGLSILGQGRLGVGASHGIDAKERLSRARTAVHALRAAFEEGAVAGGGAALLHASKALDGLMPANPTQRLGIDIVRRALLAPAKQLAVNGGMSGDQVVDVLLADPNPRCGYDVMTADYRDMFNIGILDPAKVVRTALEGARKVASAFIAAPSILNAGRERVSAFQRKNPYFNWLLPEADRIAGPNVGSIYWGGYDLDIEDNFVGGIVGKARYPRDIFESIPDAMEGFPSGGSGGTGETGGSGGPGGGGGAGDSSPESEAATTTAEAPQRHLVGDFPASIATGEADWLNVFVSETEAPGRSGPLDLHVPEEGVTLDIFVECAGLEILGERRAPLKVPARGESASVGFRLRAVEEGNAEIRISAFNGATLVAAFTLKVVVGAVAADAPPTPKAVERSAMKLAAREGEASLKVSFDKERQTYTFDWSDGGPPLEPVPLEKTMQPLQNLIGETVKEIQEIVRRNYSMDAKFAKWKLEARGKYLWKELIPKAIRDRFIERHDRIKRINIYSAGDPFPWEMLYPFQEDRPFEHGFLVEQVELCRWVYGSTPPATIPLRRADFVIPNEDELANAVQEISKVAQLLQAWNSGLEHDRIQDPYALVRLFEDAIVSLLHFACHNWFDGTNERIMVKGTPVTPTDFTGCRPTPADAAAFIFMNACHSDNKPPGYTSIGGWANCFLGTGAGAFIGTLWEVRDTTARKFAEAVYEELLAEDPKPFGEALRLARNKVKAEAGADPTWLAYSFYGDSHARVQKIQ
jgi:hypothetical protein